MNQETGSLYQVWVPGQMYTANSVLSETMECKEEIILPGLPVTALVKEEVGLRFDEQNDFGLQDNVGVQDSTGIQNDIRVKKDIGVQNDIGVQDNAIQSEISGSGEKQLIVRPCTGVFSQQNYFNSQIKYRGSRGRRDHLAPKPPQR